MSVFKNLFLNTDAKHLNRQALFISASNGKRYCEILSAENAKRIVFILI